MDITVENEPTITLRMTRDELLIVEALAYHHLSHDTTEKVEFFRKLTSCNEMLGINENRDLMKGVL